MFDQLKQTLIANRHRTLMVIAGPWQWTLQQLAQHTTFTPGSHTLWLGDAPGDHRPNLTPVRPQQVQQWLGQECDELIINGFGGIDLNALGALSGTLKAGRICILLCPDLDNWPQQPDPQSRRFAVYPDDSDRQSSRLIRHLVNTIRADKHIIRLEPGSQYLPRLTSATRQTAFAHAVYKTPQQQQAVEKIKKVATGHRRRPLVLTADRGRGKSSALGIAIAERLLEGNTANARIILSAPQVASVAAVFARAAEQLTVLSQAPGELITAQGSIHFIAPDQLIRHRHQADLVMIDEAAAIPAPMLSEMLKYYSRIVFTSTIHGYEGTGRSFEIRFKQTLNQLTPGWQACHIDQPIRWAAHDPLEHFINQALMLNARAAEIKPATATTSPIFKCRDRDQLLDDNRSLSQITGLLTLAHYKTSPNDFRHLLDGSNIVLYTLSIDQAIVGVALIAIEGNLPDDLCRQIWQGERRPKGHLLPQTLSCHGGFAAAPKYRYARVMRIAIHPDLQQRGLGSQLLQQLEICQQQQGIDFIGASFGATTSLLGFWQQNAMTVVRLGISKESTSNEYSAVVLKSVLKSLNAPASRLLDAMQQKFDHELPRQLGEFYPLLPADLVIQLLQQQSVAALAPLMPQQQLDLDSFINHRREYEFCSPALYQYSLLAIATNHSAALDPQQQQLLVAKVLRQQPWPQVCQALGYSGKKAAMAALKQIFRQLQQNQCSG